MPKPGRRSLLTLALLLVPTTLLASPLRLGPDDAPFAIDTVKAGPIAGRGGRVDLQVELYVTNKSPWRLERVEALALVVSPRGDVKGFHTFTLKVDAAAGERIYALYRTGQYAVAPGDEVVLLPYAAAGRNGIAWRSSPERVGRVAREIEAALRDGTVSIREAAENPPEPGLENPIAHCTSMCSQANATCETNCQCGIQSASCTCSRESISSSCTCFQCPPSGGGGG